MSETGEFQASCGTAGDRQPDESQLIALARRDPAAFAPLYARYVGPVYRYCYRRLGDREAAEDATSQGFTKTLQALPRYRDREGSFRSWLFTIAHNVVMDNYRRHRPSDALEHAAETPDPDLTPEEGALLADTRRTVRQLLERLAPDQRKVLELRLAGLSSPEIAAVLERSTGAVRLLQHRGITRLRAMLDIRVKPEEVDDEHR